MITSSRALFPRGLEQPEGGYRFSMDSLLLSSFCHIGAGKRGVDLGTGCGVVALALLLRGGCLDTALHITGVDMAQDSINCAAANAVRLGVESQFTPCCDDVRTFGRSARSHALVDVVVANPPYRASASGRISRGENRSNARFEQQGDFSDFCACAGRMLRGRGRFFVVHLAERLPELMQSMRHADLEPKRMRLVHSRVDEAARMVLLEGVRQGRPGLVVEAPLVVYEGKGENSSMTAQVLEFCPYLACNTGKGRNELATQEKCTAESRLSKTPTELPQCHDD